jgi:hypothetical protein
MKPREILVIKKHGGRYPSGLHDGINVVHVGQDITIPEEKG